nr:Hok/Gef family protein [Escherichia coli]
MLIFTLLTRNRLCEVRLKDGYSNSYGNNGLRIRR